MEPTLTWLDFTGSDRDRMRRVLDLFNEQGTVDEMGLGNIRDALSDTLFPGTSSIQTRMRYMLFVPWIYRRLESRGASDENLVSDARDAEIALIGHLLNGDDIDGVIGTRSGASLQRLPSTVYWSGLVRWGIFTRPRSQASYHTHFTQWTAGDGIERADDPGVVFGRERNWHAHLPNPPRGFPRGATFELRWEEADFLQGRILERCQGSLLAWLAAEGSEAPAEDLWNDPDALSAPGPASGPLAIARRFSLHVEGMPLVYNLLLAEQCYEHGDDRGELIDDYRARIAEWAKRESEEAPYDTEVLWRFIAGQATHARRPQKDFVERWGERIRQIGAQAVADDGTLRRLVANREQTLKGPRARLINKSRLLDWNGSVGVGRMDFRWSRVRGLVRDLHRGLAT